MTSDDPGAPDGQFEPSHIRKTPISPADGRPDRLPWLLAPPPTPSHPQTWPSPTKTCSIVRPAKEIAAWPHMMGARAHAKPQGKSKMSPGAGPDGSLEATQPTHPWLRRYPPGVDWHAAFAGRPVHDLLEAAADTHRSRTCTNFLGKILTYHDI